MTNIILCGGSGTRLWPLSRKLYPKQFCELIEGDSLFQRTVARNRDFCDTIYIVTNQNHYFLAIDQVEEKEDGDGAGHYSFLLEPVGRNTAPAIALACLDLDPEEIVLVTPSDHLISKQEAYQKNAQTAMELAQTGALVTFGITPEYAETGYGYIEADVTSDGQEVYPVKTFREKPDQATAEQYIASGNFYWNSGMFVFKAGVYLQELEKNAPDIFAASSIAYEQACARPYRDDRYRTTRINREDMQAIPANSIDYAVMEKSRHVHVIPSNIGWNDLGSFDSLYSIEKKDKSGNTLASNVINIDAKNNLIISGKRKIAAVGLEDCIVVDTADALLVGKKGSSQLVKKAVEILEQGTTGEQALTELHATAHRPWGTYTVLEHTEHYKIKKIVVKPGKRLSLQKHMHRSEHWVVVRGTATVTVGDKVSLVRNNESTYIPIGEQHRLANEGLVDLVIIETQVGEYVEEDDIIRIDDDFQREN
jgi:mannose-1-phosphate guanylyltransferase